MRVLSGGIRRFSGVMGLLIAFLATPGSLSSESDAIRDAITLIEQVPTGKALVQRALKEWKLSSSAELLQSIRWGEVSRTDAVLTRHYHPETGEERRQRQVTVYIRRDQKFADLLLDIAHEMTHAVSTPEWDPYDPELTAARYIHASIEGPGGEAEALLTECRIALELEALNGFNVPRCARYRDESGKLDSQAVVKDFYRVGSWRSELVAKLGADAAQFPLLSSEPVALLSSTGRAPYPVALFREYEALNGIACTNTRRRVQAASDSAARSPASIDRTPASPHAAARQLLKKRCGE